MGDAEALLGLVLAAGKGSRMRSATPKVLHPVCGRPLLWHAVRAVQAAGAARTVLVLGEAEEEARSALGDLELEVVRQPEPLGTAHAALQARSSLESHPGPVLAMYGDHALFRASTFTRLLERFLETECDLALLTAELPDPTGYGRVLRKRGGSVERIVEESEASEEVRRVREANLGVYVARGPFLLEVLDKVPRHPGRGEYLLTDVVEVTLGRGGAVDTLRIEDPSEALGVNDRVDLARVEAILRRRIAEHWMRAGVSIVDPDRTYIDADVEIGADSVLEPGCALRRGSRIGAACRIAAGAVIDGSRLAEGVYVKPHTWIEDAVAGARCVIGPSAHIRPNTVLEEDVRVGNFVEVKNSRIGRGTKADHLSYIGDADVGASVTIGCGAITVNYDGEQKHRTRIGEGAFIGCNANLIAPLTIEPRAYVAAGSTITSRVPEGALGVARARQRNLEGWRSRRFGPAATEEE
jgi:bifunctional UDP-N-acetylglucosamine pyrophosphorylase/glucosamine-1-phosphate N-acetyltransferase